MSNYLDPNDWGFVTPGGVPYRWLSTRGSTEQDGTEIEEVYIIPANKLLTFLYESFPPPQVQNGISFYQNRKMPGVPAMSTRRVRWESHVDGKPIDPFNTDPSAPLATYHPILEVTITYSNQRNQTTDNFIEISANVAGEFLHVALPQSVLQDTDVTETDRGYLNEPSASDEDNTTIAEEQNPRPVLNTVITIPLIEWTITWDLVERTYFEETLLPRLRNALGKVNSKPWPVLFQPSTVLEDGQDIETAGRSEYGYEENLLFVGFAMEESFHPSRLLLEQGTEETERGQSSLQDFPITPQPLDPVRLQLKFLEKRQREELFTTAGQNTESKSIGSRYYGWNHIWSEEKGTYQKVKLRRPNYAERNLYLSYDFNTLFRESSRAGNAVPETA